jgi:hypothetical protein
MICPIVFDYIRGSHPNLELADANSLLYLLFQKSKNASWVSTHCRKLANRHIHHWGSVSIQTKSIKDSVTKHQSLLSHCGGWCSRPIGIGLVDVRKPSSTRFSLEPITRCINSQWLRVFPARHNQQFRVRHEPVT